jgi:hypothetical protein
MERFLLDPDRPENAAPCIVSILLLYPNSESECGFYSFMPLAWFQMRNFTTTNTLLLLSLAPQPSLGLGLLHKIWLNFLEASQHFLFYRVGLLDPCPTPIPEDQASVFISPRGRVATHFSHLL